MKRWLNVSWPVIVLGLLVSCGTGSSGRLESVASHQDWDGYVVPEVQDVITSAVWNGREMVLVAFDHHGQRFENTVAAYDPTVGTWRDLHDLPSDLPVTVNALVASPQGVVATGVTCDPATSMIDGDGLACSPGDIRTFLLPNGDDAFVEIAAPSRRTTSQSIPSLAHGVSADGPYLWVDGSVFRLDQDRQWVPLGGTPVGMELCQLGQRLVGVATDPRPPSGSPLDRLVEYDGTSHQWIPLDLPAQGNFGTLHCGLDAAWFELMNEEPARREDYLIRSDGDPTRIKTPPNMLVGSITFDGTQLTTWASEVDPGTLPSDQRGQLYILDTSTATLVSAADRSLPVHATLEVYPLDGISSLYATTVPSPDGDFSTSYEVDDTPKVAS
ncbi:MAG TPA: hypothetical protein VNQ33_03000 [Acidimicrobiales bacterium]|nr:hypothetical protein [Acidimicrobiales bacterium]